VNIQYVHELYNFFAGRMILRLKDDANTELSVARDRVKALKDALQI
jgi:DNA-binding LytR/AlgR family response regulator